MLRRRQVLAASATTLPLLVALTACAGPDPLAGPPPLSADTRALLAAVTAEANLIWLYKQTMARYSALGTELGPLLADHQAHLGQLAARITEPTGKAVSEQPSARPKTPASSSAAIARLRAAEQAAVTAQLRRLADATPSEAQLFASIAACEATHVTVLAGRALI